jgi:GT2 family glycosyltransferase
MSKIHSQDTEWISISECLEALASEWESERRELEQALRRLEDNQHAMNVHVVSIENSLIFTFLRWLGRPVLEWKAKLKSLFPRSFSVEYRSWLERHQSRRMLRNVIPGDETGLRWTPKFTLILSVEDPKRHVLEQNISAIIGQTHHQWELYLHNNAADCAWNADYFAGLVKSDARIHLSHSGSRVPRIVALNDAISRSNGDYVLCLDSTTVMALDALHEIAWNAQDKPDLIYTDEGELDDTGSPTFPIFKPDWSPDLLLTGPYIGQLLALSREKLTSVGGIRPGFDGAEFYDLALRFMAAGVTTRHVPVVLSHCHPGQQIPPAAAKAALEDYVQQHEPGSTVERNPKSGFFRIRRRLADRTPLVSIIICSRSAKLLDRCLGSLLRVTAYRDFEAIVVEHVSPGHGGLEEVSARHRAKSVPYEGPFHFSRMNNLGAAAAKGPNLIFLNDDTEPLTPDWLSELVLQVERPEVGIVGAKLLYPSGTLQHAGVAVGIGDGCGHPGRGRNGSPFWRWLDVTRNVSAVTGACMAIRKELFDRLGGFSDIFPVNYNDVDLCLRAIEAGYSIIYEPAAVLRHYECQSRPGGVTFQEREQWHAQWSTYLRRGDPFYNPNLTQIYEDLSLGSDG